MFDFTQLSAPHFLPMPPAPVWKQDTKTVAWEATVPAVLPHASVTSSATSEGIAVQMPVRPVQRVPVQQLVIEPAAPMEVCA